MILSNQIFGCLYCSSLFHISSYTNRNYCPHCGHGIREILLLINKLSLLDIASKFELCTCEKLPKNFWAILPNPITPQFIFLIIFNYFNKTLKRFVARAWNVDRLESEKFHEEHAGGKEGAPNPAPSAGYEKLKTSGWLIARSSPTFPASSHNRHPRAGREAG